ncbi:MAG: site-specific DNA-methyltransferase, partial [Gemmataceae bacterium]
DGFALYQPADKAALEAELNKAVAKAKDLEIDPETTKPVKDLRARLAEAVDLGALEADVFDHLHRFFSRYYDDGDFISKRRYSADGKYAIPYDGEEVKLHWANHDQYYIKTSEYLRSYAFRLRPDDDANPMRVRFELADAAEGEHGNVKAAAGKDRAFVLAPTNPIFIENGELTIRFEYRPATLADWPAGAGKPKPPAQKDLTGIAEDRILKTDGPAFRSWVAEFGKPHIKADGEAADYSRLRAHLNRYVARNTFDYFIHKDLGGFLRRELDFYIKNEVLHLDDIESAAAPRVEQYLSRIRVIRRIAGKIIDFLAQLEDFQRALWLKKKFVVETHWCVALKEVPETFHKEIAANKAQQAEWKSLGFFDLPKDAGRLFSSSDFGFRIPNSAFVDTRHFPNHFTERLLAELGDLDEKTDGVLFHSENFQALNLMQARYKEQVKCIYIDPPYNTGNDGFAYKDSYQHSSWLTMMFERLATASQLLLDEGGVFHVSIGEDEQSTLREVLYRVPLLRKHSATVVWKARVKPVNVGDAKHRPQNEIEYVHIFESSPKGTQFQPLLSGESRTYPHSFNGRKYRIATILKSNRGGNRRDTMRFEIDGYTPPEDQRWQGAEEFIRDLQRQDKLEFRDGTPFRRYFEDDEGAEHDPYYCFMESEWSGTSEIGKGELNDVLTNQHGFDTVKPTRLIQTLTVTSTGEAETVLDFFGGSGTTGHAVLNLNREDGGRRKFILVEMADYFDTVLLPRLKKVAFTPEWKDGKPKRPPTEEEIERGPRLFKIVRLESYEDTLNNLELKRTPAQQSLLDQPAAAGADKLREQYLLQYLLKVESRGSPSLLNVAAFADPEQYRLTVKRPGSDESRETCVDLIETFNWLLGLRVSHFAAPHRFTAKFEHDSEKRLKLKGGLKETADGAFRFRRVEGTLPNGRKALVVWRTLTGKIEEDNLVLDTWMTDKLKISTKDFEFDAIYVNGDNNLENLKTPDDQWKVRLIEEDFHRLMFAAEGV